MFEEHQAEGIFQDPPLGVAGEILLQVQTLDAGNDFFRVADFTQDLAGLLGVEMLEPLAPFQIARARHRIRIPRH